MSTRERILTIRLMEIARRQPVYAASLGIDIVAERNDPDLAEEPP